MKPNKFKAKPIEIDGITFHSTREGQRYAVLKLLLRSGDIKDLKCQPRYPLMVGSVKVGEYRADFDYTDTATDTLITEDVKGFATDLFKWKQKHFEAQYGRQIRITK